jgi:hypothetical protein
MKVPAVALVVAALTFAGGSYAAAQNKTYTGEIMDSACAAMGSHDAMIKNSKMTAKDCTVACVAHGAKYVLFNPDTKTVYQLDDQKRPVQFAGAKVAVTGTLDNGTKTIHVTDMKAAAAG